MNPFFPTALRTDMFKNRIVVTTLSSLDPAESIETTWRVLAQVETSRGPILVKSLCSTATFKSSSALARSGGNRPTAWWIFRTASTPNDEVAASV